MKIWKIEYFSGYRMHPQETLVGADSIQEAIEIFRDHDNGSEIISATKQGKAIFKQLTGYSPSGTGR